MAEFSTLLAAISVPPLAILAIGIVVVVGMIIVLRINAFIALITAAIVVSLLAPGDPAEKIKRVAEAFGSAAGKIGIVIALAAVIGKCMMDSGSADRVVRAFLRLLGEKRASFALMGSGFVLAVPVFFDTVFYLLVPLARSLYRKTNKNYLLYLLAIAGGGAITHTLVPPTPGPLIMAEQMKIDIGVMIIVGALVAAPSALIGIALSSLINRLMVVPMRQVGDEPEALPDDKLPPLWLALLPVLLPVLLISTDTVVDTMIKSNEVQQQAVVERAAAEVTAQGEVESKLASVQSRLDRLHELKQFTAIIGNANLALLLSAAIAVFVLYRQRGLTLNQVGSTIESSLMSGGVIILITAGGGAFGAMLKVAEIGPAIERLFASTAQADSGSLFLLFFGFGMASLLKVAQGSSTVAMITASSILASMGTSATELGFNPAYLATAIGSGSLVGSWMNDSGFWIFAKMGGLTEVEALKSWTPLLAIMGIAGLVVTLFFANVLPLTAFGG